MQMEALSISVRLFDWVVLLLFRKHSFSISVWPLVDKSRGSLMAETLSSSPSTNKNLQTLDHLF